MHTALLLIDIQRDYFNGGRMELENPEGAVQKASALLGFFRKNKKPCIHIQHISQRPDATFFLPGDSGTDIHSAVSPLEGESVIRKHYPNSFRETNLLQLLQDVRAERVVIGGMMTHMCVDATVRAAVDLGFKAIVVSDACATRTLQHGMVPVPAMLVHAAFLAALKTYGNVMTLEETLSALECEGVGNR
jgi:nicotinamidase-related amidase